METRISSRRTALLPVALVDCGAGAITQYKMFITQTPVSITVADQFPVRALTVQVGDRAADKIVFSMAELTTAITGLCGAQRNTNPVHGIVRHFYYGFIFHLI